jgi:succinate-semialdehyde dehydrogenase/glutarate-semialdehyde dehydrogenase
MKNKTECFNPFTSELIGFSELTEANEIMEIVKRARIAQKNWELIPFKDRQKYFCNLRDLIVSLAEEIAEIISNDNGKIRIDALTAEVLPIVFAINYYLKNAKKFLKDKKLKAGNIFLANKRSFIRRVPEGVVAIISPWNYPFTIPMYDVICGLMAGNAVILKAASETQMVGRKIEELIFKSGFPENIFSFVNLPGSQAGDALLNSGIDKLFFTGSVDVGKTLAQKAASKLIPVSLELGGNDAMIILDDADVERAVGGAIWGGFHNAGQSCGGIERIYVHEKIYDEFMNLLKRRIEKFTVLDSNDFNSDMGVMTTIKQKSIVEKHIQDAVEKGAQIFAQSEVKTESKNAIPATVLTNVNHSMLLMREETFGPVVGVMKYSNIEEAIKLANDSHLGLTASVWSSNNRKAMEVAKQIQAGAVNINDHLMSHGMAETPWGGFKDSGNSRSHGEFGFLEMTKPQVIIKDILPFVKRNLWWHPYNVNVYNGLLGIIKFLYSKKLRIRTEGLKNLLKILPRIFKV